MKINFRILFVNLLLTSSTVFGQLAENDYQFKPMRFIDKVELVAGPTFNIPDDNGFSERLKQASMGSIENSYKAKFGYSFGVGLGHTITQKLEVAAKVLWEKKGWIEEKISIGGTDVSKYEGNLRINYLTVQVTPVFHFSRNKRFHIYIGFYYSWLQNSFQEEILYLNNQPIQQSSVTNSPHLRNDYGLMLGFGRKLLISENSQIVLRLQGNYGLSKITDINTLVINSSSICFFISYQKTIKKSIL